MASRHHITACMDMNFLYDISLIFHAICDMSHFLVHSCAHGYDAKCCQFGACARGNLVAFPLGVLTVVAVQLELCDAAHSAN